MTTPSSLEENEKGYKVDASGLSRQEPVRDETELVDEQALKRVIRKIDKRLIPPLAILYLFSYLDRSALANASIFGFKKDLHLTPVEYNLISTIFFIVSGFPSQSSRFHGLFLTGVYYGCPLFIHYARNIIVSMVRASLWITFLCATWGMVMTLSGLVNNFQGAMAARFFLGVAEAGFFPAALSLVGDWYPRKQSQSRISAFYVVGVFSGAFGGALAYAIHNLEGVGGLASWRWIFILEGMVTVVLSPLIFFLLPNAPETCKFLTAEEKEIIKASRAANGNGTSAHFEWKYLRSVVIDYKVYMTTFMCGSINIAIFGFTYTMPTILLQLGYTAANVQLMIIPIYAVACTLTFGTSLVSDRIVMRSPGIIAGLTIALIGLVMLYQLPKDRLAGVRYFACVLFMSGAYCAFPGTLSWVSNNSESRGKRNIAIAFQMTLASLATIAGTNTYLGNQAPDYPLGFGLGIGVTAASIVVAITLVILLKRENRKLDQQREEYGYLLDSDLPPDFRYIL